MKVKRSDAVRRLPRECLQRSGKKWFKKKRFWKKVIVFIYLIFQRQYESHIKKTFNSSEDAKTTVTKFELP